MAVGVAAGWPVVGDSVDCAGQMMVGKYISMVVWDRKRGDLLVQAC